MQTGDVLDSIGGLAAQLKAYAAKLPAIVHLTTVPTGMKPKLEAVDEYEGIVSRFRNQSAGTAYKGLNESLVESLEAFEVGKLLGSVQPLLAALDHLECNGTRKSKWGEPRRSESRNIVQRFTRFYRETNRNWMVRDGACNESVRRRELRVRRPSFAP